MGLLVEAERLTWPHPELGSTKRIVHFKLVSSIYKLIY